ncbi:hypothetical protein GMA3_71 [Gordonia phage GMA3]|uniref:Uncharacterized protein n=1 Tax=Gordonia phage GMA3 TaxID=1647284 RepID=A0A0K0NKZ8_9CAUD|nr:hypothetical protein AU105_gp071 [Gordonia phage GMA3]AKL88248.1 hypothetical protein GMA3_71 [Gordonia phage GMA3]
MEDAEVRANSDSSRPHGIYIYNDELFIEGCDCSAKVDSIETAIEMRDLIDKYINERK